MPYFAKILSSIPWFVWLLFIYIIIKGIKALKSQVISIKKIFILPLIFLYLGIKGLIKPDMPFSFFAIWLGFFIVAAYLIWHLMQPLKIICDKHKGLIQLTGSKTTLIILLSIFISKFTFGFLSATHPEFKEQFIFNLAKLSISGTVCGISLGRLFSLLSKFLKSSHVDLQKAD